eukprot:comp16658_c0_seq1/m.14868 comp16658_c0_seq1/g.14868  ORF comp16658_c0_seq1/g.14868 comp16658_c0_seq1/m.14868 type:complete len:163 (-) comp16658_c0_seq1:340-828(-)
MNTADLWDKHEDQGVDNIEIVEPIFTDYGRRRKFHGQIYTLKVHEDNTLVKQTLGTDGQGKVLVVDGGGSRRMALVGDNLANMGVQNGWAGVLVYGSIRDSEEISTLDIGMKALCTNPRRSVKKNTGEVNVPVKFGGVTFRPGHWLYADTDGILVSPNELSL